MHSAQLGPDQRHSAIEELSRRQFVTAAIAGTVAGTCPLLRAEETPATRPAQIAITLDLEMSRHYPRREIMEWDFQKGNLDDATKAYAVKAARIAKELGGLIHFFCVGRVLAQWPIHATRGGCRIGRSFGRNVR